MPVSVRAQLGAALTSAGAVGEFAELRKLIVRAARAVLRNASIADADMSITLLDDDEIAAMNGQFLAHEGVTDVISFALYENGEDPVGDIYIGWQQAERQAAQHGVVVREEVARLTIHGVLHVLGYDHPDDEQRTTSRMWRLQEEILARVRLT
jgi:probable rRNA maturation factor